MSVVHIRRLPLGEAVPTALCGAAGRSLSWARSPMIVATCQRCLELSRVRR
jgi:hypothetical protein